MRALPVILFLLAICPVLRAQENPPVYILIPRFESSIQAERIPGTIGQRTATIFSLQIWRTLRPPPGPQPRAAKLGGFFLSLSSTPPKNRAEAEAIARQRRTETQLVLWGKAFQYGAGIVVESKLSIRQDGTGKVLGTNIWKINASADRPYTFTVDIPDWEYEFAPIVLSADLLPQLSDPSGLKLYSSPSTNSRVVGVLGRGVSAKSHSGDFTDVIATSTGRRGWVYLPNLSKEQSEVIDFCGGIIRIFRTDWDGAIDLLKRVVDNSNAPTAIKVSAYLYMGIAAERMGDRARSRSFIRQAHSLNPYQKAVVQYLCMSHLADLVHVGENQSRGAEVAESITAIKEILSKNKVLFSDNDPWLAEVQQFLSKAENAGR